MNGSKTNPDISHGKKFEKFVSDEFKGLKNTLPVEWKRVIDTAAANTFIAKADGDFEWTVNSGEMGKPYRFRIECKASVNYDTFSTCFRSMVKSHQNASMILTLRAGICGVYLFQSVQNQEIEVWYAGGLCKAYDLKRQKYHGRPAYVVSEVNFPKFARMWATDPKTVLAKLLLSENRP